MQELADYRESRRKPTQFQMANGSTIAFAPDGGDTLRGAPSCEVVADAIEEASTEPDLLAGTNGERLRAARNRAVSAHTVAASTIDAPSVEEAAAAVRAAYQDGLLADVVGFMEKTGKKRVPDLSAEERARLIAALAEARAKRPASGSGA